MKKILCLFICVLAVLVFCTGCNSLSFLFPDPDKQSLRDLENALVTYMEEEIEAETEGFEEETLPMPDTVSDKQKYNDYITSKIIPEIKDVSRDYGWGGIAVKNYLADMDNDGTEELILCIYDSGEVFQAKGVMNMTCFMDIIDGEVEVLETFRYNGGTIEWGDLALYTLSDGTYVLEKINVGSGGYYDMRGMKKFYDVTSDGLQLTTTAEMNRRGFGIYGDDLEDKVRQETSVYEKDSECITTYKVNGKYVLKDEYDNCNTYNRTYVKYSSTIGDEYVPIP